MFNFTQKCVMFIIFCSLLHNIKLRSLAFGKSNSKSCSAGITGMSSASCQSEQPPNCQNPPGAEGEKWEQWREKDEQVRNNYVYNTVKLIICGTCKNTGHYLVHQQINWFISILAEIVTA